ncbi:16873_t:CDS:2, partial [Racocetra fulgida]
MSITSSKAEQHSRTSVKSLKLNTKRDSTIDTTVLSSLLSNYNLPALASPNSLSGEINHVIPPSPLTFAVQCATMATIEFIITNYSHMIELTQLSI